MGWLDFSCEAVGELPPDAPAGRWLAFSWNREMGLVTGPHADYIRAKALPWARVTSEPEHRHFRLSGQPLKSLRDMAIIVGQHWQMPLLLAGAYPREKGQPDGYVRDQDGNAVDIVIF